MLYSCTHMSTVGVKGLTVMFEIIGNISRLWFRWTFVIWSKRECRWWTKMSGKLATVPLKVADDVPLASDWRLRRHSVYCQMSGSRQSRRTAWHEELSRLQTAGTTQIGPETPPESIRRRRKRGTERPERGRKSHDRGAWREEWFLRWTLWRFSAPTPH